ncbi:MAG: hypothetical protein FD137_2334 [Spirochaetes bacterium]|nr:MAG: hypothetical protein FD137_2334 [Spirochaetota bacterium]
MKLSPTIRRFCLLFFSLTQAFALWAQPSFFHSISLDSYSSPAVPVGQFVGLRAGVDFPKRSPGISFFLKGSIPYDPFDLLDGHGGFGAEIRPFAAKRHFLEWLSPRRTHWAPSSSVSLLFPFENPTAPFVEASLSPLRLYTGWGNISFLSFRALFDETLKAQGWGIGILEFGYYPPDRRAP